MRLHEIMMLLHNKGHNYQKGQLQNKENNLYQLSIRPGLVAMIHKELKKLKLTHLINK